MTEFQLPNDLSNSLNNIVRFQNTILLKEICRDYNWDYNSFKKKYIKDKIVKNEMKETENTKKEEKKKSMKKKKKTEEQKEEEKTNKLGKRKKKIKKKKRKKQKKKKKKKKKKSMKKKIKTEEQKEEEKPIILGKRKIKVKKVKKKRIKEDEIECRIFKYNRKTYYVSDDNCAYDIDGDFCGILEENENINFDAEPAI